MKIKLISIMVMLLLLSCSVTGQERSLTVDELKKIITFAKVTELNTIVTNFEKKLNIRLIELSVTEKNHCFPESHGICEYDYYLSVSQFDEHPEYNLFKIGRFGQISHTQWIKEDKPDYAEILIVANKYSIAAMKYNKKLVDTDKKILLQIDVKGVIQQKQE